MNRNNAPAWRQPQPRVDWPFRILEQFRDNAPELFTVPGSAKTLESLVSIARELHRIGVFHCEMAVPAAFDYVTLGQFLRALWIEGTDSFKPFVREPRVRGLLVRLHLAITDLRDFLRDRAKRQLGYDPFILPLREGKAAA